MMQKLDQKRSETQCNISRNPTIISLGIAQYPVLKTLDGHCEEMSVLLRLRTVYLVSQFLVWVHQWFIRPAQATCDTLIRHSYVCVCVCVSQGCLLLFPPSTPMCATDLNLVSSVCRLEQPSIQTHTYLYASDFAEMVSGVKILLYLELINRGGEEILK